MQKYLAVQEAERVLRGESDALGPEFEYVSDKCTYRAIKDGTYFFSMSGADCSLWRKRGSTIEKLAAGTKDDPLSWDGELKIGIQGEPESDGVPIDICWISPAGAPCPLP